MGGASTCVWHDSHIVQAAPQRWSVAARGTRGCGHRHAHTLTHTPTYRAGTGRHTRLHTCLHIVQAAPQKGRRESGDAERERVTRTGSERLGEVRRRDRPAIHTRRRPLPPERVDRARFADQLPHVGPEHRQRPRVAVDAGHVHLLHTKIPRHGDRADARAVGSIHVHTE